MSTNIPIMIVATKYITERNIPVILVVLSLEKINAPRIAKGIPDSEKRMIVYPREDMLEPKRLENDSMNIIRKPGANNAAISSLDSVRFIIQKKITKTKIPIIAPIKDCGSPNKFISEVGELLFVSIMYESILASLSSVNMVKR
jgi:hypothetical protein